MSKDENNLKYDVALKDGEEHEDALVFWPPFQLTEEIDAFIIQFGDRFDEADTNKAIVYMRGSDNCNYRITIDRMSESDCLPSDKPFLNREVVGFSGLEKALKYESDKDPDFISRAGDIEENE